MSLKTIIFIIFFTLMIYQGYAAKIRGVVTDAISKEPLIGAVVGLRGQVVVAQTGLDGSYIIRGIEPGDYVMLINYLGYQAIEINVSISESTTDMIMDATMKQTDKVLQEVEVLGTEDKSTDESATRTMQNSQRIINVVSAKTIEISPDITVANVVQRVSGISIERNNNGDGQHAILRGMDKRYNYTLVNGVKIPSPDDKYRYVPLDIFPAEVLDRIEVTKSLTSDMEGDAVGGVINLVMKDAPSARYISANIASGYSEMFLRRDFASYNHANVNRLSPYEVNGKNYMASVRDFPSERLLSQHAKPAPNLLGGLALGNRFFGGRLGAIAAVSYQNTYRGNNSLFFETSNATNETSSYVSAMNERFFSEEQVRYALHAKLDYKLNTAHKLQWYNAFMNLGNFQNRDVKTTGLSNGFDPANGNANLEYSLRNRYTIQQIFNSTLQGEHAIVSHFKINWSAVYSFATNEDPDNTTIKILGERRNYIDTKTLSIGVKRSWQHNSDHDVTGYLNLIYKANLWQQEIELSTGGMIRAKERSNLFNAYNFAPIDPYVRYGIDFNRYDEINLRLLNPKGSVANVMTHTAFENISAGYLQLKAIIGKSQIISGLRIENTNQGYGLVYPLGENSPMGEQNYTDILPGIHYKYKLTGFYNIKASYYRSINRPGFYEIIPFKRSLEEYSEKGNLTLKRAVADNVDVRLEFIHNALEQICVGLFYKNIKNPIETALIPDELRGNDVSMTPQNYGTATNLGLEIDAIKYFRWFGINVNYTYTNSSITTQKPYKYLNAANNDTTGIKSETRALLGQSAHIGNVSLLVKDVKSGINAQLAFSYTGERIYAISDYYGNNFYQEAFMQMDASFEKRFFKYFTLFLKANNLLDTPLTIFIKNSNPKNEGVPNQNMDRKTLIRQDYYQRSYMVGLRFKL